MPNEKKLVYRFISTHVPINRDCVDYSLMLHNWKVVWTTMEEQNEINCKHKGQVPRLLNSERRGIAAANEVYEELKARVDPINKNFFEMVCDQQDLSLADHKVSFLLFLKDLKTPRNIGQHREYPDGPLMFWKSGKVDKTWEMIFKAECYQKKFKVGDPIDLMGILQPDFAAQQEVFATMFSEPVQVEYDSSQTIQALVEHVKAANLAPYELLQFINLISQ